MTVLAHKSEKKRIVSAMRVTGRMHLGNYHGALRNWLELQHKYDCYFFAADLHALTTHYEHPEGIAQNSRNMIQDWLAAGLDPERCKIFIQSGVAQHAELHLLLSMITPLSWLERVPTYKDQQDKLSDKDLSTYGFLGYPLLQSADILLYKPDFVPVGDDQVAHVELTREIARRFNFLFARGQKSDSDVVILHEPQVLLTATPKFPGLDGRKMSKSYDNTIALTEAPDSVSAKIKKMPTDPARVKRTDPGEPTKCPVWEWHKIYSSKDVQNWAAAGCRSAGIGCIDCKKPLIDSVIAEQKPIIERAKDFADPKLIDGIIRDATEAAKSTACQTLTEVQKAMGIAL